MTIETQPTIIVPQTDWVKLAEGAIWGVTVLNGEIGVIISSSKPDSSVGATDMGFILASDKRRDHYTSVSQCTVWGRAVITPAKVSVYMDV